MQNNYQNILNIALKELSEKKDISSALSVCNALLEYMGAETKSVEDISLSKLKLPNAERYDRWFDLHPHFRGDRACFELTPKNELLEAKFYSIQKRSKLFISGAVNFSPNFEDRDYTRNDPSMKVGIDFFLTPQKDSVIVALSNKGNLRLVELSGRLSNTQNEIFTVWHNVMQVGEKNALHVTMWESFKLSSLNEKFYDGISNSFTSLTQHLQKNGVEEQLANQFANRLHGRLLFLWFLRKKNIINETKEYFTLNGENDTDYYNKTLSVLFFNVLNNENHKDFDPVTPYLNGGLFDQKADGEYWNTNKPTFPTGFFRFLYDHFDSFNFTTDESTPEYEQIAIDPEMLGRIFESFLATLTTETGAQAKKANGAFYTPREIVSYMSRESLRQYLYTALDANVTLKGNIDEILDRSDSEWALAGTNSRRDTVTIEERKRILDALENIKVLDPAVGSGAFPMGVLHKILSVVERLDPTFDSYETKLSILKNNIYGVDIDPTAVEISRLRAWLSLVVDVKDIKKIKPLPNLDFKFVCAHSLISLTDTHQKSFTTDDKLKDKLMDIRNSYYESKNKKEKLLLQKEYLILTNPKQSSLLDEDEKTVQLRSYQPFEIGKPASFYDPELMHGVSSFDIVIGNPPYVSTKGITPELKVYLEDKYGFADDLYSHFYFRGLWMCKTQGVLSYITSKTFWTIQTKKNLRELLLKNNIIDIYDTANPFASAMVDTCVILVQKNAKQLEKINFLIGKDILLPNGKKEIDYLNPNSLQVEKIIYENAVNKVIFNPSLENLAIYQKYNASVAELMKNWWPKINTSKNISKNGRALKEYRDSLKCGELTLLGLITDGGQGLATGNNGKYVGILSLSKEAPKISDNRTNKFFEFVSKQKITEYGTSKESVRIFLNKLSEQKMRELFDSLKEKYGRDIFGQGFLYRIIGLNEIKNVSEMTDDEKKNGLSGEKTFVPYDKGDKDGNRWYLRTPYYIDWSKENVDLLKRDPKARYQGYQFYFRSGFCWINVLNPNARLIKTRLKEESVNDVGSMSLYSFSSQISDKFCVCLLNSNLLFDFYRTFINFTVNVQINDIRQLPIIIPTKEQLADFEDLFDRAYAVKVSQFDGKIINPQADQKLQEIQKELDEKVLKLYKLTSEEIKIIENSSKK